MPGVYEKGISSISGLAAKTTMNVAEQVRSFVGYLKETREDPGKYPGNFRGHAYLLYQGASQTLVE